MIGAPSIFFTTLVVYYESLKREVKTKTIYGFRCDERLKTKDEVNNREIRQSFVRLL